LLHQRAHAAQRDHVDQPEPKDIPIYCPPRSGCGGRAWRLRQRAAAEKVAAARAKIFGTDLPDVKISLDSLDVMEEAMRHFYVKAMVEKSAGELADWKAVDASMIQAASIARDVAAYRHAKLSAVRLAGEITHGPADGATLDELLERIKGELNKLGPILDIEVVREPEGSRRDTLQRGSFEPGHKKTGGRRAPGT
jgi:hypothetical protein